MDVDGLVRRSYPGLVLALLAVAAYLQAKGVTYLVASTYLDGALSAAGERATESLARPPSPRLVSRSSGPILGRNVFDSATGPLSTTPEPIPRSRQFAADLSNPLAAPTCGDIEAHAVTESLDPTWSTAVLHVPAGASGTMLRQGDSVGDRRVVYIGYNPARASPAVWLLGTATLCQVLLFASLPAPPVPSAEPAAAPHARRETGSPRS